MINLKTLNDYAKFPEFLNQVPLGEQNIIYRELCRRDLFFLLTVVLGRKDLIHPWLLDRCKEIEKNPNGYLDLWARAHGKSSIITFGKTIQDILASHGDYPLPEWNGHHISVGIFSFNRPIAKQFLSQIKREFENNYFLIDLFPDILFADPGKESPSWSIDSGIIVKRSSNQKEATVEAWGVVESQPTSKHFDLMIYDDMVTVENVRSGNMIEKTRESWELSLNLGTENAIKRYIGTRYHFNDCYKTIIERKAAIPRLHPATKDATPEGEPVLLTKEALAEKRRFMGNYTFASQMLLNPVADNNQGFQRKWLEYHEVENYSNMNKYIIIDPANEKKQTSDYTAVMVVGLNYDENYYILDMYRDRLSLTERAELLFQLHRKYRPRAVGYEKYGMQADLAHIRDTQKRINYNFKITELGGSMAKVDRIKRLVPLFEQGRIFLPVQCHKTNYEKKTLDLTDVFVNEEYLNFPVSEHDDMLDALARITDEKLNTLFPKPRQDIGYNSNYSGASFWSA